MMQITCDANQSYDPIISDVKLGYATKSRNLMQSYFDRMRLLLCISIVQFYCSLTRTFSRHDKVKASSPLLIWLIENVLYSKVRFLAMAK